MSLKAYKKEKPFENKLSEKDEIGLVCEELYEICENTMHTVKTKEIKKAEYGISSTVCDDGTPFDCGPSGGANSPYTEVNAENQGVISEVPINPEFYPEDK